MSFGNDAFILKISDTATISGSNINLLTPNFFLGSNAQYISGSGGNIEISSSNFHLSPAGDVEMAGDVNAINGVFENVSITGNVITGSNIAFTKPGGGTGSGLSGAFLLESWFTSSFVRNRASGNSVAALETKFATGNTFNYGIFGWTASLNLQNAATGYSGSDNPLGTGYNVAAANYYARGVTGGDGGWESVYVNPGPPPGFKKWKDEIAFNTYNPTYGPEYNSYGNEMTTSYLLGTGTNFVPTVDQIIFLSPKVLQGAFSITSSLIVIPSASLGSAPDPVFGYFKNNYDPIGLQFAMRMQSGSVGGLSAYGQKWQSTDIYKTFYIQCEIQDESNNIVLTERRYVYGADDWQIFNIPITPTLNADLKSGSTIVKDRFKIIISWSHSGLSPTSGKPFVTTKTNLVAISELRLVQYPKTLGLRTDSLQFGDSYFSNGDVGTQHFGSIYPTLDSSFDLGTENNQWKTLYADTASLGKIKLTDGIVNSKATFGFEYPDSLIVYDGLSSFKDLGGGYYPALQVDYGGNVSMYNDANVGMNPYSYHTTPYGTLNISGTIQFQPPGPGTGSINEFSGEVWSWGIQTNENPYNTHLGDIFFLTKTTAGMPAGTFAQNWNLASAANVASSSGMLSLGIEESYSFPGGQMVRYGIRGQAAFTGSHYQALNSASGVFPGDKLYLSTTPGKFQTWAPTGSGEVIRIIGYCTNYGSALWERGSIYFAPETSWIENV
jgi:hypothetical protein